MAKSDLNLEITIQHSEELPFDARELARDINVYIAGRLGNLVHAQPHTIGRVTLTGDEARTHVRTFIRSSFFSRFGV